MLRPGASLPCGLSGRRAERDKVLRFLTAAVQSGGCQQALYISGMPGTGKTASFLEAVETLQAESVGAFTFVHVNGLRLSSPGAVFAEIVRQLGGSQGSKPGCCEWALSESQAYAEATRLLTRRPRSSPMVVLLVDEVDC